MKNMDYMEYIKAKTTILRMMKTILEYKRFVLTENLSFRLDNSRVELIDVVGSSRINYMPGEIKLKLIEVYMVYKKEGSKSINKLNRQERLFFNLCIHENGWTECMFEFKIEVSSVKLLVKAEDKDWRVAIQLFHSRFNKQFPAAEFCR